MNELVKTIQDEVIRRKDESKLLETWKVNTFRKLRDTCAFFHEKNGIDFCTGDKGFELRKDGGYRFSVHVVDCGIEIRNNKPPSQVFRPDNDQILLERIVSEMTTLLTEYSHAARKNSAAAE